jgi:hypothetical protein
MNQVMLALVALVFAILELIGPTVRADNLDNFQVELKTAYTAIHGTESSNSSNAYLGSGISPGVKASLAKELWSWLGIKIAASIEQAEIAAPTGNSLTGNKHTLNGLQIEVPVLFPTHTWLQVGPYFRNQDRMLYRYDTGTSYAVEKFEFNEKGLKVSFDTPKEFTYKTGISFWGGLTNSSSTNAVSVIQPKSGTVIGAEYRVARKFSGHSDLSLGLAYEQAITPTDEVKFNLSHVEASLGWSLQFDAQLFYWFDFLH